MENQFEKTDKICNNIYLIDERLCLSDSYNILNFNFNTLSANCDALMDIANQFNTYYTFFTQSSSDWNVGAVNTNNRSQEYNSTNSCINSLSSIWNKEFSVIYPFILEINDYYTNSVAYQQDIKSWLSLNFPIYDYSLYQKVNIYLNLYQIDTFTFSFSGKYEEKCLPSAPPLKVCCTGASCPELNRGCNIDSGPWWNRKHHCINAYSRCGKRLNDSCVNGGCPSFGGRTLSLIQITNSYNDTYTARSLMFNYQKQNETDWTQI